jgi:hypothetical protein
LIEVTSILMNHVVAFDLVMFLLYCWKAVCSSYFPTFVEEVKGINLQDYIMSAEVVITFEEKYDFEDVEKAPRGRFLFQIFSMCRNSYD